MSLSRIVCLPISAVRRMPQTALKNSGGRNLRERSSLAFFQLSHIRMRRSSVNRGKLGLCSRHRPTGGAMAETTTTTRRRRPGRARTAASRGSSATRGNRASRQPTDRVLSELERMVSALIKENRDLHRRIDALNKQATTATSGTAERALRSIQLRISRVIGTGTTTRRRRTARAESERPTRRKITDPAVLERRRQALAKAREARAAKRAGSA